MDTTSEMQAEIARLERLVYVPGAWKCPRCDFRLMQMNLHAADGAVTARDQAGDRCPNCHGPLWRVTEREAGNEMTDTCGRAAQRARDFELKVEALQIDLKGALTRANMLFEAKNHWADRARRAEGQLAALGVNVVAIEDREVKAQPGGHDPRPL